MTLYPPKIIADIDARRLSMVLQDLAIHHGAIDTGTMAWDGEGSWANYAAGLGLSGPIDGDCLDELVDFYQTHDATPKIRVTPYQDPSVIGHLAKRGFTVYDVETVLARDVDEETSLDVANRLHFRQVDPSKPEDVTAFMGAHIDGFYEDSSPSPAMRKIMERMISMDPVTLWLVTYNDEVLASGGLETYDEAGVLICGSVLPKHRNQGLHRALIAYRTNEAAKRGLSYVTIGSAPAATTERNALHAGFTPAYTELGFELKQNR